MLTLVQTKSFTRVSTLVVVFAALLLAGCFNAQSNVALYGNGQWSGVQAMTLSADFVQMMESSDQPGGSELTTETEGLDEWVQQAQSAANRGDLNVSFDEVKNDDGSLSYILQASGQSLETLNEVMFQGQANIEEAVIDGQKRITIMYDASQTDGEGSTGSAPTPAEEQMTAEMMQAFGISIITKISGGEIINHNADRVEGGTAIWETPKMVEITLTEAAELNPDALTLEDVPNTGAFDLTALIDAANQMETGAAPTTQEPDTAPTTDESAAPTTETTTQSTVSDAAPQDSAASAEATTQSTDAPANTPAVAEDALPTSGAILPGNVSDTPLVFGGLVLMALVGAGTVTALRNKK